MMLTLKPIGLGQSDDWPVFDSERHEIGRVMRHPQAPRDAPWFWPVTARVPQQPTDRGYAATRETAMASFKAAWLRDDGQP